MNTIISVFIVLISVIGVFELFERLSKRTGKNYVIYQPTVNRAKSIGGGTKIGAFCDLGSDVVIGNHCNIQAHVTISNGCVIEDDVFIGPNTSLLNDKYIDGGCQPITVKQGARIGGGCVILPGVTISEHMFVGAGSVVVDNFPQGSVVYGNPAVSKETSGTV